MSRTLSKRSFQDSLEHVSSAYDQDDDSFKYLVESAGDGIIVQQDGCVAYANPRAIEQIGAEGLHDVLHRPLIDFVAPEDRSRMEAFRRHLMDGGGFSGPQGFRRKRLDGTVIEVVVAAVKIRWKGRPALLGIIRNATQRERIEISLEASDDLHQRFLSSTARSLWETDAGHRFVYVSDLENCDLLPSDLVGKTLWEALDIEPENQAHWQRHLANLDAHRPFFDFEYSIHRRDGVEVLRSASGVPMFDVGGDFTGYRGSCQDITEYRRAKRTIEHMALHDALTGLPNRFLFSGELQRTCDDARRSRSRFAVFFLDLDHFKDVNDTLGHSVGDKLLIEVARRLGSCLHGSDLVARFGGDEFVMVVNDDERSGSTGSLADRLNEALTRPYDIDGLNVHSAVSIGIACFPDHGTDGERLLASADLALYAAKRDGRGTWRVFDHLLQKQLQAQRSLDESLRHALAQSQFQLHYQPLISVADERIAGFEALVRWNHPARGQMLPKEFIPAAEQYRHVVPLTEWILQEATAQQRSWASAGPGRFNIAINVPPALLKLQSFVDLIDQCAARTNCSPSNLTVEITEGTLIDEDNVVAVLSALRERGVTIAIDDFGTGFSSMRRLKTLPVDILKIERSFLADVVDDASEATIVEALVKVGHSLGKTVVAEGVETREQFDFLKRIGCDIVQGFLFSEPMPATDVPLWIDRWTRSRNDGEALVNG